MTDILYRKWVHILKWSMVEEGLGAGWCEARGSLIIGTQWSAWQTCNWVCVGVCVCVCVCVCVWVMCVSVCDFPEAWLSHVTGICCPGKKGFWKWYNLVFFPSSFPFIMFGLFEEKIIILMLNSRITYVYTVSKLIRISAWQPSLCHCRAGATVYLWFLCQLYVNKAGTNLSN